MVVKRGDIFYADLDPIIGSEQGGIRPVLVVQNNVGNKYSPPLVVLHKGGINVFGFLIGLVIDGAAGVFAMCLCKAASDADRCMNQTDYKD